MSQVSDPFWSWRQALAWRRSRGAIGGTDPLEELSALIVAGAVPVEGYPEEPNVFWSARGVEAFRKLRRSDGLPLQIPPQFFQDLELRIVRDEAELWWRSCGLLAWSYVHFSRDYLVRAWTANLNGDEKAMAAAAHRANGATARADLLWGAHLKRVDEIPLADVSSASPKPEQLRRGPQGPLYPISDDAFQRFDDLVAEGLRPYTAARRVTDEGLMSGSGTPVSLVERLVKAAQNRAKPSS